MRICITGENIMPYIERTITAGKVKEVTKYHTFKYKSPKKPRGQNSNSTPILMAKVNQRKAEDKLRLLLNENFRENDLYLTLTYEKDTPDAAEAKSNITRFIRKLRDCYKKIGSALKYVAVTEYGRKRIHHHMLINYAIGIGKGIIKKVWAFGFSKIDLFGGEPDDCERLANYLVKETSKTFNTDEKIHGLRWIGSKNLVHPVAEKRVVSASSWREQPKPVKGYYIDVVKSGINQQDYPYQFYRLIKIEGYEKPQKNE